MRLGTVYFLKPARHLDAAHHVHQPGERIRRECFLPPRRQGTGFDASSVVSVGSTALSTTFGSATSLAATVPASLLQAPATLSITVTNSSSGGAVVSGAVGFSVLPAQALFPQITSISPASVFAGSASILLTVTGSGFDATSVVGIGSTHLATTFVSATSLQATVPSSYLQSSTIQFISATNTIPGGFILSANANLTVLTPTGQGTIDGVASVSTAGILGDGNSSFPGVSTDGRYVAFASFSANLTALNTSSTTF